MKAKDSGKRCCIYGIIFICSSSLPAAAVLVADEPEILPGLLMAIHGSLLPHWNSFT
jgi:hypothetical protein